MADKKKREAEEFVVVDRRKFTAEGEVRPGGVMEESSAAPPQEAPAAAPPPESASAAPPAAPPEGSTPREDMPPPPSQADQTAQNDAYVASGQKLDEMMAQAGVRKPEDYDLTFEKLIVTMYMTAMMQLGMVRGEQENAPRADIMGARQTIDTLALLQQKTKGNLTLQEEHLLQNVLFELRMATVEITNAIARGPLPNSHTPRGAQ